MTIWYTLQVPQCERRIAHSLGAEFDWHTKTWSCSKGRYQSEAFKRWRSRTTWTTFLVFVEFAEVAQAKQAGCRFSPERRRWFYHASVGADELPTWIRDRLKPPAKQLFKLPFDKRHEAKAAGACWDRDRSAWTLPLGVKPPESLLQYAVVANAEGANPSK
jgi:hypothetical protein